jgi:riboflavin kinase/FMN adenylyltransferase
MKIIHELTSSEIVRPTVLTWGVFDGLHIGHQKIIGTVVERARSLQATPTMLTFEPHPRAVLRPETAPPLLQTLNQRLEGLRALGIEQTIIITFTHEFASITAERFLREIVFGLLDAQEVYLGHGVAFGHNREGRIDLVFQVAQELGRVAAEIEEVTLHGHRVRSTTIRRLLRAGRVNLARKMLGRPYGIEGRVVKGRGVGQELLFPTANLQVENNVIPAQGVYITLTLVEGTWRPSATNIGTRPTFDSDPAVSIECHILDFQSDILGQPLRLRFLHRLRDEKRFPSVEALKQQIQQDLQRTRRYFGRPGVSHLLATG